ncbi:S-adenosyl-L-methionine-dependent methyltransferase [Collybia nuda]|uniref:S-adenosyl-L-methionine-dependent methyltransferase n=1 Tax=Collybia nuda TaxID=64659 RepID=A0A9P6CMH1_9AGAR|nr:S-adenosyl-L-methionine-dependent methyltransferase [Collybia nuda]
MSSEPIPPASAGSMTPESFKAVVEDGYNIVAPAYLAWSSPRPTTTRMGHLDKLISLLAPGASVLELGCGAGVPCTRGFIEHGLKVTGVDISATQIALAREHVPQATLIHRDMMSLSFEQGSFDAVVGFYSIIHLPQDEQGPMIRKMVEWLKEGGWMLFNLTVDAGDQMMEDWMGAKMVWSGHGVEGNRKILKEYGESLDILEDEVAVEVVGKFEEQFHWILATKKAPVSSE